MTTYDTLSLIKRKTSAYNKLEKGEKNINYSDCILAVAKSGEALEFIPQNFITDELCLLALNNNAKRKNLLKYIPESLFTDEFIVKMLIMNGINLKHLPPNRLTKEILSIVAKKNPRIVKYLPIEYQTDDVYKQLIQTNIKTIKYIKKPDGELANFAIEINPTSIKYINDISILSTKSLDLVMHGNWRNLRYLPPKMLTRELCKYHFEKNWRSFEVIPNEFKTREWCELVLEKNFLYIQYCPEALLTNALCLKCVNQYGGCLNYIPTKFKTEEICLNAVIQDSYAIRYVPSEIATKQFYIKCIHANISCISLLPAELQNTEMYKIALEIVSFSDTFKEWLKSGLNRDLISDDEKKCYYNLRKFSSVLPDDFFDIDIFKMERKLNLRNITESYFDKDNGLFIVCENYYWRNIKKEFNSFEEYYSYLCNDLSGAILIDFDFAGVKISDYNLNGAFLSSNFLFEQKTYDDKFYNSVIGNHTKEISNTPMLMNEEMEEKSIVHSDDFGEKLNLRHRKIYYVTDLHLNHKLLARFPIRATVYEVRFFIHNYIKKMLNSTDVGIDDYLLIGGDTSFSFDISQIFFEELTKFWKPQHILVILGNHELWESNCTDGLLVDIISRYKTLFDNLGIVFLQNSLFIDTNFSKVVLHENDILNKNTDELLELVTKSNLLVFGSIGFSAYNKLHNAKSGMYNSAISSIEQELEHVHRCQNVYNKLASTLKNEQLIVLTHMPLKDWSIQPEEPNWIYVNGHTHSNEYIKTECKTIYADNQIGYQPKSVTLKYFYKSLDYDIFRNYSDGIYHISKQQYLDFYRGNGIMCNFNKSVDYITMLKRQGLYLFLLEIKYNNTLHILNGGQTKQLNITNLDYYYENMLKYGNFIKDKMRNYNHALKKIADLVKKIGGDGRIHGGIVDIDFFNHIYLNPSDGSISIYYSPSRGEVYAYSNLETLLSTHSPQLYENYNKLLTNSNSVIPFENTNGVDPNIFKLFDTSQYKTSYLLKGLQYLTENNIIRKWSDHLNFKDDEKLLN